MDRKCRFCLKNVKIEKLCEIDENISEKFFNFTQKKLSTNRASYVCNMCLQFLDLANEYKTQWIDNVTEQDNLENSQNNEQHIVEESLKRETSYQIETEFSNASMEFEQLHQFTDDQNECKLTEEVTIQPYEPPEIMSQIVEIRTIADDIPESSVSSQKRKPLRKVKPENRFKNILRRTSGSSSLSGVIHVEQKTKNKGVKKDIKNKNIKFPCAECSSTFKFKCNLYTHVSIKHPKIFKCDLCDENCNSKFKMRHHMLHNHMEIQKYECQECSKAYTHRDHLNRHILTVHQNMRYCCTYPSCVKSYRHREDCRQHFLKQHKNVYASNYYRIAKPT